MDDPPSENESQLALKLKKSLRLNKKLQEKINFERQVSHELAKRNEQLKKDFASESSKYRTLVLAFEDLFLEYKDLLDIHGSSLTNGLPATGSEGYQKLVSSQDHHVTVLNTIRAKAGIERHAASEDILHLTSGSSLLRKSSEAIMKTLSGSPLSQPEGLRPRASSYRMIDRQPTQSHSRRQSTMSLPLELETTEPTEDDHSTTPPPLHPLSNSQEMNLTRMQSLSDADLVCSEATNDLDLLLNCDSSHTAVSASNHSTDLSEDTIPLFEHFLVIGASVDTSIDISNEIIDKQTRLARGRLRSTLDIFFGRGNSPHKNQNSNEITPATLAQASSVKRGSSYESDFASDTASVASDKTTSWRGGGGLFSKRSSVAKHLGSENGDAESTTSTLEHRNSDGQIRDLAPPSQPSSGWSSRFSRMMGSRKDTQNQQSPPQEGTVIGIAHSIPENSEAPQQLQHQQSPPPPLPTEILSTPQPRRHTVHNSTWTGNFLSKLGVSTAVTNDDLDSSSGEGEGSGDDSSDNDNDSSSLSPIREQKTVAPPVPPPPPPPQQPSTPAPVPPPMIRNSSPASPPPALTMKETTTFVDPEILYRFPEDADAPPSQICGFCLPNGARLKHLVGDDEENKIIEILYGENHDSRSGRSFIFILEDKTLDLKKHKPNDESGASTGRTYGICVIHPRWLNVAAEDHAGRLVNPDGTVRSSLQFEAETCYCFISRFPLFDFFFKMIWSIISYERIVRMENITSLANDRSSYEYLPMGVYDSVLERLTNISPPKYNESLSFQISSLIAPVEYHRLAPLSNTPEHLANAARWALPPLLHFLSPHLITWVLGLLMCEVKLIVVGTEPALVSCTVIGLIALLKPLVWPNPVVPFIPSQFMEFLQSIPPIIGGILRNPHSSEDTSPLGILQYIGDYDNISAVLDLSSRDIFVLSKHSDTVRELMLPGGKGLIHAIEHIKKGDESNDSQSQIQQHNPKYNHSVEEYKTVQLIQRGIRLHIKGIVDRAKSEAGEVLFERMNEVERKNKEIMKRLHNIRSSISSSTGEVIETLIAEEEEDHDENGNGDGDEAEEESDSEILNGELILASVTSSSESSPLLTTDLTTEPTDDDQGLGFSSAAGGGVTSSGGTVGGDVESVVSVNNVLFTANANSSQDYHKFLRRFISTQMFSEYDKDFVGLLRNVENVTSIVPNET